MDSIGVSTGASVRISIGVSIKISQVVPRHGKEFTWNLSMDLRSAGV